MRLKFALFAALAYNGEARASGKTAINEVAADDVPRDIAGKCD